MFYYDPSFGYVWITAEKFGGHVLLGRGPVKPFDPESIEEQRYTANDKLRWLEAVDLPDEWLDALGVPRVSDAERAETIVYDITIEPPHLKQWQGVLAVFVWLIAWILWNLHR